MVLQLILLWVAVFLVWRAARSDVERRLNLEAAWTHRSNLALITHKIMCDSEAPKVLHEFIDGLSNWCFDAHFIKFIRDHGLAELGKSANSARNPVNKDAKRQKGRFIRRGKKKETRDPVAELLGKLGDQHTESLSDACREFSYITLYADRLLGKGLQIPGARYALRPSEDYVRAVRQQLIEAFSQEDRPGAP